MHARAARMPLKIHLKDCNKWKTDYGRVEVAKAIMVPFLGAIGIAVPGLTQTEEFAFEDHMYELITRLEEQHSWVLAGRPSAFCSRHVLQIKQRCK